MAESSRASQALNNAAQQAISRCLQLASCTEEPGRITRRFLTEPVHQAHQLVRQWMNQAGMRSWVDAAGNVIGVQGDHETQQGWGKRTILIGSHLDTVPNAGAYDGVLGVMIGLAVAQRFQNEQLPVSITVVGFSEEEGVRFAQPYLGSAALAGTFPPAWLGLTDSSGQTVAEVIRAFGLPSEKIPEAAISHDRVCVYVEPHIEQGPILAAKNLAVGAVTSIIGQTRLLVRFTGEAGHAGTTPMEYRRDALVAAAQWTLEVQQMGRSIAGLRATVGRLNVSPNATNVIPAEVTMSLDLRHAEDALRLECVERLLETALAIAERSQMCFEILQRSDSRSVAAATAMVQQLVGAMQDEGQAVWEMTSGAGHDAVIMGERFPMAMLFIRHPGGISHHPDEHVEVADVQVAIDVLTRFIQRIAILESGATS